MENVQIIAYRFNYPDDMEHSGVKGQKWGVRRYQNPDGSLTPLGRIRYRTNGEFKKSVDRQRNLAKAREAKKAKKIAAEEEAKKQQEHEEERQKAIKSGSAADALKFKGELSPQEMQYISTRLQWEQNMQTISNKETSDGKSKVDEFFKSMDKAVGYAQTGAKAYNTVANVVNAFNGEKVMPKIDTNITNGNKKDVKDHKKEVKKQQEAAEKRAKQEAEGDAKRAERAKKKAEAEQNNRENQQQNTDQSKQSKKEQKAHAKSEDKKVYTGTVEGDDKSKSSMKNDSNDTKKSKPDDYYDPIDADWRWADDTDFNAPAIYNSGRNIVSGYLEDKYR